MTPIRVLIADDAIVVRRLLTTVINEDPELEIVGVATNGAHAVTKAEQLRPDVITLDIEMPEMDGLEALAAIRAFDRRVPIIMFSTLTERGAAATLEALSLGASDYVTKPANVGSVAAAMERVRQDLIPRIKALCRRQPAPAASERPFAGRSAITGSAGHATPAAASTVGSVPRSASVAPLATAGATKRIDLVVIGSSTGGPVALSTVLQALPANLSVPVLVTQHMPPVFTRLLAQRLDTSISISVREAEDGDPIAPGVVLIAPGDQHVTVTGKPGAFTVRLDDGDPVNFCRPSVDVMFDSVADHFGGNVLAVVLTGMGHDGRDGCATLRHRGAKVVVQDEATSVVWGMPGAVAHAGLADAVLPLEAIGQHIVDTVAAANSRVSRARVGALR